MGFNWAFKGLNVEQARKAKRGSRVIALLFL
jgi:hypothetical protein